MNAATEEDIRDLFARWQEERSSDLDRELAVAFLSRVKAQVVVRPRRQVDVVQFGDVAQVDIAERQQRFLDRRISAENGIGARKSPFSR